MKPNHAHAPKPLTGRHVLFGLFGVFAVVLGVNLLMAYYAKQTFMGVTSPKAYEEGLAYNQTLATKHAMAGLVIQRTATPNALVYSVAHQGHILAGGVLTYARPLGELPPQTVTCTTESLALHCPVPALAKGQWHINLVLSFGTERIVVEDLWLQP